jgi:thioredoxin-related protein
MRLRRLRQPTKVNLLGWVCPLALLVSVGVLGAVRGGRPGGDVAWQADFETAQKQARQSGRPLLIEFHTPGCVWCAKMEAETFADTAVVELSRRFLCLRLDGETETALRDRYHVMEYPTTVFADAEGGFLGKLPGYVPPSRFVPAEQQILNRLDKPPVQR